ncbi:MAG: SMC-Scp complex subunit ScpB [Chloroflexota bacterium]
MFAARRGPRLCAAETIRRFPGYEQPVTRADIRDIRSVDSGAVIETLRARGLVAEDARFGGRPRAARPCVPEERRYGPHIWKVTRASRACPETCRHASE